MPRTLTTAVAATMLLLLLVVPASSAAAQESAPLASHVLPAGDAPNFTPSASGPRRFMLNILGRVLGAAMPSAWKAEQIGNQHRYNASWDGMDAQFGYSANHLDVNGNVQPIPVRGSGSYDDAVIDAYEAQLATGGTNGRPNTVPATRTQKLIKGAGGAAVAMTGFSFGTAIGSGTLDLLGYDADGAICGSVDAGAGRNLVNLVTGTDCSAYDFDHEFAANAGIVAGYTGGWSCQQAAPTRCARLLGIGGLLGSSGNRAWCFEVQNFNGAALYVTKYREGQTPATAFSGESLTLKSSNPLFIAGCAAYAASNYVMNLGENTSRPAYTFNAYRWGASSTYGQQAAGPTEMNPDRQLQCSVLGTDGITYTSTTAVFKETGEAIPAPCDVTLPPGVGAQNVEIVETGGGQSNTLYDQDVTAEYAAWWNDYPECRTGACKLDLITLANPSFPVSCFDLDYECDGWFESPDRDTDYECHYGIHTVDIEECFVYSGVFREARILAGAPYSDPMTGTWSGGINAPTPDSQALAQEIQDPEVQRACRGLAATNFDPVAFVMRPVQCALEWAFVPRQGKVDVALAQVEVDWQDSVFVEIAPLWEQFTGIPVYTGCNGMAVSFTITWPLSLVGAPPQLVEWNFGGACTGDMRVLADNVRSVAGALIYLSAALLIIGYVMSVINFRRIGEA